MPMYDRECKTCGKQTIDVLERINAPDISCECGGMTQRVWLNHASAVIGDDIPGGMFVNNGICHENGEPRKFYSKSEMRRAAAEKGWVNHVEHKPDHKGTDRSKHTSRWI